MARTADLVAYLRDDFGAEVQVSDIRGGKRLEVTKGDRWAKIDVHRDHVNWLSLTGPWLKEAHKLVRTAFKNFGIAYLVASPLNAKAEKRLKQYGPWRPTEVDGKRRLRWDL